MSCFSLSLSLLQSAAQVDVGGEKDLHKEYARQREHMERTVASLRKKLTKDAEIHRADTVRVMQVRIGREGREEGRKRGRKEGREEGRKRRGRKEGRVIVNNMLFLYILSILFRRMFPF